MLTMNNNNWMRILGIRENVWAWKYKKVFVFVMVCNSIELWFRVASLFYWWFLINQVYLVWIKLMGLGIRHKPMKVQVVFLVQGIVPSSFTLWSSFFMRGPWFYFEILWFIWNWLEGVYQVSCLVVLTYLINCNKL